MTEGCGPHCPCWRKADSWMACWPGEWGYCQRDVDRYEDNASHILAGDLSRTKEKELEDVMKDYLAISDDLAKAAKFAAMMWTLYGRHENECASREAQMRFHLDNAVSALGFRLIPITEQKDAA